MSVVRALVALAGMLSAGTVSAQSFPIPVPLQRSTIDLNGVDLAKGQIAISETDLSIGPQGAGGLAHTRFWSADTTGGGWRHGYLLAVSPNPTGLTISLGDHSVSFTRSQSTPYTYTSDQVDGSTLTPVGSSYSYVARDGTVIFFDNTVLANNASYYGRTYAVATSITRPSGEKITLAYYQDYADFPIQGDSIAKYVARLQSVTSSTGARLQYSYASDDPNAVDDWYRITNVGTVQMGLTYCDPATNCPTASSVSYNLTGGGTVESVTDPAGRTKVYTTDGSHHMIGIRRASSSTDTLTIGYGADGRVATVSNGSSTWSYSWSLSGTTLTGTVAQPLARQRIVTADSTKGNVLTDKDGLNHTTTYSYDTPTGRLLQITAPEGGVFKNTYDTRGNITRQYSYAKPGAGLSAIVTYASFSSTCPNQKTCNQPTSTTDALGNVTNYTYDLTNGGVLTVTSPAGTSGIRPQTRFSYTALYPYIMTSSGGFAPAASPIYKLTSTSACQTQASCAGTVDEVRTTYTYGAPGSANSLVPTVISKGAGDSSLAAATSLAYDYFGNVTSVDGPLPGSADTTLYTYNGDRQVTQVTSPDPDGGGPLKPRAVQYSYGLDGQVTSVSVGTASANGSGFAALQVGNTAYDYLGRKIQESVSSGGTTYSVTQYSYDLGSRVDCVAVRMNPGAFSSLPAVCSLSGDGGFGPDRITRYTYDAADEQLKITTGYGTGLQRDEITNTWSPDGKRLTVVDAKGNKTTYTYDGFDRLSKTAYPTPANGAVSSTTDYEQLTYDAGSRVTQRRLRDGLSISYGYDALNRVNSKVLPNSESAVSYAYDNFGRLTSSHQATVGQSFTYDALGRQIGEGEPFGSTSSQYDLAGHRIRLTWNDGFFVNYDYDLAGEVTAIRENGATSGPGILATFTYDDLGRRVIKNYGNGAQQSYSYDGSSRLNGLNSLLANYAGNVLNFTFNPSDQIATRTLSNDAYAWTGAYNVSRSYTANGLNQYGTSGALNLSYDGRGNLTGDGSTTYAYTSENALKSATGATNATIYYDMTNRVIEYDTSVSTRFLYDGPDLIAEINNPSGTVTRRFVHGTGNDEPLVWYQGADTSARQWLLADERGSVVAASNSAGAATAINAYDAYGYPNTGNTGRFQYTGQTWLAELGLYNFKARLYSPTIGRFLQSDPTGYSDGLNTNNYTHSDPVNGRDTSGLETGSLIPGDGGGDNPFLSVAYGPAHDDGPPGEYGSANGNGSQIEQRTVTTTTSTNTDTGETSTVVTASAWQTQNGFSGSSVTGPDASSLGAEATPATLDGGDGITVVAYRQPSIENIPVDAQGFMLNATFSISYGILNVDRRVQIMLGSTKIKILTIGNSFLQSGGLGKSSILFPVGSITVNGLDVLVEYGRLTSTIIPISAYSSFVTIRANINTPNDTAVRVLSK